jgi:GntR family transcriptional regulator
VGEWRAAASPQLEEDDREGCRAASPVSVRRALAEEYGVALGTIRRAMDELRDRGLVTTLSAKGTFVTRQG